MEAEGPIATAVTRNSGRGVTVDTKSAIMVQVFKEYGMNIVGISETKWFGLRKYKVNDHLILHSGHPVPAEDEAVERNEGAGIVLDPDMARLWKEGGEVWKPISSRIVSARRVQ